MDRPAPMPPRRIAHLDMDAFFASVELLRYPELRGRPVVVGGRRADAPVTLPDGTHRFARLRDYVGRGVLTTATYEARVLGVHSGLGTMKAARLAPDAVILPANFDAYRHYSRRFKAVVAAIAPRIEDRGIDEIYIDLTDLPDDSLTLAQRLKHAVHDATGLTCSIGITPNKLLSKIASDLDKPNGITILYMDDVPTRIWPLPVKKINGIGPKATAKLAELGIGTVGELAAAAPELLQKHFGLAYAVWLQRAAQGLDDSPLRTASTPKSMSRETTFERDLHVKHDRTELSAIFTGLCGQVAADLQRKGYVGRTVGIKLRFADFTTVTRDLTLNTATADAATIRRAAGECLRRIKLTQRLRLLGVRASHLSPAGQGEVAEGQAELPLQAEC